MYLEIVILIHTTQAYKTDVVGSYLLLKIVQSKLLFANVVIKFLLSCTYGSRDSLARGLDNTLKHALRC